MASFTKQAIRESFLRLLDEYPLRDITVKMIVETCGINRKSFYYHYQDIPALLEEIVMEGMDEAMAEYRSYHSLEECLDSILHQLLEKKKPMWNIYRSVNRDVFETGLMKLCDYVTRSYMTVSDLRRRSGASDGLLPRRMLRPYYGLDDARNAGGRFAVAAPAVRAPARHGGGDLAPGLRGTGRRVPGGEIERRAFSSFRCTRNGQSAQIVQRLSASEKGQTHLRLALLP